MQEKINHLLSGQRIKRLYEELLKPVMKHHSLTKNEVDILLFLHNNPGYDTARDIVDVRGLSKSHVCQSIEVLVKRRYLATRQDEKDRRCIHLILQRESDPAVADALKAQNRLWELLFKRFSPEETRLLESAFEKMYENVQEALAHGI